MKSQFVARQFLMVSIALIAAIMLQLVTTPITARADDGTTPPSTEEQVAPTPPAEEQTEPTPPVEDEPSVSDLPENVELVVVGTGGEPEPLASQAAAEAIANSDPFWCPDGSDPVGGGCTAYATFTDLLTGLQGVSTLTNGTVYVQAGLYGGPESQVTFNGNTLTNIGNLSLIGGWDLAAATPSQVGVTTFDIPVSITNWTHNVSVQDIVIDGATGSGLTVNTTGQVLVDDVIAVNNTKDGIHIEAGDSISVTDVKADSNGDDGVEIVSDTNTGAINLNTIQANSNTDDGIRVYSKAKSNVTIKNITSNSNGGDGLNYQSPQEQGDCTYKEIFIPEGSLGVLGNNGYEGPILGVERVCFNKVGQTFYASNIQSNNNEQSGLYVSTTGNFWIGVDTSLQDPLTPIETNGNGAYGFYFNVFTNTEPFPWAYYRSRAKELDATLYPYASIVQETEFVFRDSDGMRFTGPNDYYYTDAPGTHCSFSNLGEGVFTYECWSPPTYLPILGDETLDIDQSSGQGDSKSEPLCSQNSIVILQLPNQDNVTVFCPISGQISVKSIGKKGLPGSVPDGATFVSSLAVNLLKNGAPASTIKDGGHLKISFAIPADLAGKNFVIMYWDEAAGKWVEFPAFADNGGKAVVTDLGDGRQVLEGTKVLADVGLVEASVNFPGMFMLVVK